MEFDLSGTYPIILEGEEAGELCVERDGLYWVFDAKCARRPGLLRLSVFGADGEGYLGVMEPCGDALVLTKRLSRHALSGFPTAITHAGAAGEDGGEIESISPPDAGNAVSERENVPPDEAKPPSAAFSVPPSLSWLPCPCPCSLFSGLCEKAAFGAVSGAYFALEGEWTLLAIPMEAAAALPYGLVPFLYQIKFGSALFFVCVIENGKAIRSPA